jgi:hypothetical protein
MVNKNKELIGPGPHFKCYSTSSIGVSNKHNCRLIMEDSGYLENRKEKELIRSNVKSILAVEKVKRCHRLNIGYDKIFVLTTFSDELKVDDNCIFCSDEPGIHELKDISFEEWERSINNRTL